MKLIQFFLPGKGKRVGLVQGYRVFDITVVEENIRCTLDVVTQGKTAHGEGARQKQDLLEGKTGRRVEYRC